MKDNEDSPIEENLRHSHRAHRVRKACWFIFSLILIGALLGLFGDGWLSKKNKTDSNNNFTLEYDYFLRQEKTSTYYLIIQHQAINAKGFWISRNYFEKIELEKITPEPDSVVLLSDKINFYFNLQQLPPFKFNLYLTPKKAGGEDWMLGLINNEAKIQLSNFIYP